MNANVVSRDDGGSIRLPEKVVPPTLGNFDETCIEAPTEAPPVEVPAKPAVNPDQPWTQPFEPPDSPIQVPTPQPGTHPVCFIRLGDKVNG